MTRNLLLAISFLSLAFLPPSHSSYEQEVESLIEVKNSILRAADIALKGSDIMALKQVTCSTMPFFKKVYSLPFRQQKKLLQAREEIYHKEFLIHQKNGELYKERESYFLAGKEQDLAALAEEYALSMYYEAGKSDPELLYVIKNRINDTTKLALLTYAKSVFGVSENDKYSSRMAINLFRQLKIRSEISLERDNDLLYRLTLGSHLLMPL